ncbi:hypothetical protein AVEN_167843-1 [Araneus ventricosus]|uniref:Uncharacterized protein n=1 Tax=Araneus ventricosus TaxID=182803 RepID=A0A4Y2KQW0_ARAVE|nr:hypothetical protein AVEN_167843-1 [Araneus ventricosus]
MLTSRFKAPRRLFWAGLVMLNLVQTTRTTPELTPLSPNFHTNERALDPQRNMQQVQYTTDLQWNRVSNLVPAGPKAETLPLDYRGHDST